MKKAQSAITFIIMAAAVLLAMAASASAVIPTGPACSISPSINAPLLPDSDCDGVIDQLDNCPFITNPLQQDIDGNGLGNACDLYIESMGTSPSDFVFNGRAFTVTATFHNNREYNIRNARVRVLVPDLGIESVQYLNNLDVCSSQSVEFALRAPICAPAQDYPVFVEATFMNVFGVEEKIGGVTGIRVVPDDYCQMVMQGGSELGNTYVNVLEIQDVYKGSEAVFPIKISNREFSGKDYEISVTGLSGWGAYRLVPNSLVIVPAGSDRIADLYIAARPDVPPGERAFVVTIKSGEEYQRFLLIANVKEAPVEDRSAFFIFGFKMLLLTLLVLFLIALVAVGIAKYLARLKADASEAQY